MVHPVGNKKFATIEKVKWHDIKKKVTETNPEFAKVIDQMVAAGNDFPLYIARYSFGTNILKSGTFYIPTPDGQLVPINDTRISSELKNDLNYTCGTVPLGLILNHSAELFMEPKGRSVPFTIMKKGKIFSLWGVLNPQMAYVAPQVWHIVAGTRTLFMLPKVTDSASYKKLARSRGVRLPLPRTLLDQGAFLAQMSRHKDFTNPWHVEILFFSLDWLKERKNDPAWIKFHHFLLQEGWNTTEYWSNKVVYDYIWDAFVKELAQEGGKVNPHIIDIVKHLITLGLGMLPGFRPALDDEVAPISAFQSDFINIYGLKHFAPTIMVPEHFSIVNPRPIYWSLQLPTYFESSPKPRTETSVLTDLREIHILLERFLGAILNGNLEGVANTPINDFVKSISYDFFHSDADSEGRIKLSKNMPNEDDALITNNFGQNGFSHISPFVRGCIRIGTKNNK